MSPRKLVVRAPNWVGDLAMATPVLAAAGADPRWDGVDVVVRGHLVPLLEDAPFPHRVHPVSSPREELERLRALAPDAILLLSTSFRSAWLAWRAGIEVRAGAAAYGRRLLLTHALKPPTRGGRRIPSPTARLHRDVAALLGLEVPDLRPRLGVGTATAAAMETQLSQAGVVGPYVLVCPGAAFGAAKLWPPERFAAALDALVEPRGWTGIVAGSSGEQELVRAVAARSATGARTLEIDLPGLRALIARAELLLVGDSGPRWVAAAFEVPCVAVLGPTFVEQTATSLERARLVRGPELECAPCLERRCPLGHHRCLGELSVERVLAAAGELLGA